jgi:hypothetical protein
MRATVPILVIAGGGGVRLGLVLFALHFFCIHIL